MNWNTENPKKPGQYLVTVLRPMMIGKNGEPECFAYMNDVAEYYNGKWNDDVIAWQELPKPYFPNKNT